MGMELKKRLAFKEFDDVYREKIYNFIALKINDYHEVEDIMQNLLMKLYDKWDEIENHYAFARQVAMNDIMHHYRDKATKDHDSISTYDEEQQKIELGFINGNFERIEVETLLTTALNNINIDDIDKEILRLQLNTGYSEEEIGNLLGLNRSSINRRKDKIKEKLLVYLQFMGLTSVKDIIR